METISLREAMKKIILNQHENPVISVDQINWYIYNLYQNGNYQGTKIGKIKLSEPDLSTLYNIRAYLIKSHIINELIDDVIYSISNKNKPTVKQIICCANPYSYLSYITAMEWHGLTDRIPSVIHITRPTKKDLKSYIGKKILNTFSKIENDYPLYPKNISISSYELKSIEYHQKKNFTYKNELFDSGGIRVSTIGETFLDMLKQPELCGGISHVIDTYVNYAKKNLPNILKTVTLKGSDVDKARVGYILEEMCHIKHETIDSWKQSVQRGGSRKLVAANSYSDKYSETWCISINI